MISFIYTHYKVVNCYLFIFHWVLGFLDDPLICSTNSLSGIPHYQEARKRKYSFHVSIKKFPDNKSAFKGFR